MSAPRPIGLVYESQLFQRIGSSPTPTASRTDALTLRVRLRSCGRSRRVIQFARAFLAKAQLGGRGSPVSEAVTTRPHRETLSVRSSEVCERGRLSTKGDLCP